MRADVTGAAHEWLFVLCEKGTPLAGWWLVLRDPEELTEYLSLTDSRYARAFTNYLRDSLYGPTVGHGPYIQEANLTLTAYLRGVNRQQSIIDALTSLAGEQALSMLSAIMDHGRIYVNPHGGWNWCMQYDEGDFARAKTLVWPDYGTEDIRISMFPGGMHYYAHIGNTQVSYKGCRRFWTEEQARKAAAAYIAGKETP